MRPNIFIALVTAVAILSETAAAAAAPPSIAYTTKVVERRDPKCPPQASAFECPHIAFTYPVIERAPRPGATAAINQAITDFLLTSTGEPRKFKNIDAAMASFMQGYQEYKQLPGAPRAYWEERTIAVRYRSDRLVSLQFDLSFFFGGLHPQYASTFASFDAAMGAKLGLADVLVAGSDPRLLRIAERKFRDSHGITPGMTLRDAGYIFFKNDTFALNDNFWIGPAGITFYYNPYEIAPYAMGPTELLLTYREIGGLIKPDGLLGRMK